jgi:hypothetical protein
MITKEDEPETILFQSYLDKKRRGNLKIFRDEYRKWNKES